MREGGSGSLITSHASCQVTSDTAGLCSPSKPWKAESRKQKTESRRQEEELVAPADL